MTTNTTRAGLRKPELTDSPNAQLSVGNLADDLDAISVPVYATSAARDTANPSPTQGQLCYVTSTATGGRSLQQYTGSAWARMHRESLWVRKATNETVTSNTTMQNDDELFVSVEANTVYHFLITLFHNGPSAGDLKVGFIFPTGSTVSSGVIANATTLSSAANESDLKTQSDNNTSSPSTAFFIGTDNTGSALVALLTGSISVGSTAGTFQLQWAQVTSNASPTYIYNGSHIKLDRVG